MDGIIIKGIRIHICECSITGNMDHLSMEMYTGMYPDVTSHLLYTQIAQLSEMNCSVADSILPL